MRCLAMSLLLAGVTLAGCGGGVQQLAKDTCAELEGAIVLQVGPILSKATSKAEDIGATAPQLGDAMREACPATMAAIEKISDDREAREKLPTQMSVDVVACTDAGASGTVVNNSGITVDVSVDVQYLDAAGVVADDGWASVRGLRAGETGNWEDRRTDDTDIARCRANVGTATEQ